MKKIFFFIAAAICAMTAMASQTIYLDANDIWDKDGAKLIVHSWGSADNDAVMTQVSGHIFKADIPDGQTGLLFKRLSPECTDFSTWCNREGYWGKTKDQTITAGKDLCKITGWEAQQENDWCGDKTEAQVGVATCEWGVYDGSGTGGGGGGGGSGEGHYFYVIGTINGTDMQEPKEEYMFDQRGRLAVTFPGSVAYVNLVDEDGNYYMTEGWVDGVNDSKKITFKWANGWANTNKWKVEAGKLIYIIFRSVSYKGDITCEIVEKSVYDNYSIDYGGGSFIQNVSATLDFNAPMYDVLGRKVGADYKGIVIQNGHKFVR